MSSPIGLQGKVATAVEEVRDLGLPATLFRLGWELKTRLGGRWLDERFPAQTQLDSAMLARPLLAVPDIEALRGRIADEPLRQLRHLAQAACAGRILCFGHWVGDYATSSKTIDWQRNPRNGRSWQRVHWSRVLRDEPQVGDIKLTWEIGRFPHAYHMVRAALFYPDGAAHWLDALASQIEHFVADNPPAQGAHWVSGQELALRLLAWCFAAPALHRAGHVTAVAAIGRHLRDAALHIERHIDYARIAVYNNHLLAEALALYLAGVLLCGEPHAALWRHRGRALLDEGVARQFAADGGYIQNSHNYHRVAVQYLLWARALALSCGDRVAPVCNEALERSLDFLLAHQLPTGRLPNYGSNDGALPSILSTCDFTDFRPTLQAASLAVRGERLYGPGPWDEEAAWFCGAATFSAPLRTERARSKSFAYSGYHVLRGAIEGNLAALRCGTLRDRFTQIDQLHLDLFWRGYNVLVDPGSYLYNAEEHWHRHFVAGASHNTLTVDGQDQMLHFRRFKMLYRPRAELLTFAQGQRYSLCAGEHEGFVRHSGCVHRRAVLAVDDDLWVVVDRVHGPGTHRARLHWLCGDYPFDEQLGTDASLTLHTPAGPFAVLLRDGQGSPLRAAEVVVGQDRPPRGWLSRYYAEKVPVPSLSVEQEGPAPLLFVTVLGGTWAPRTRRDGDRWEVLHGPTCVRFELDEGVLQCVTVQGA